MSNADSGTGGAAVVGGRGREGEVGDGVNLALVLVVVNLCWGALVYFFFGLGTVGSLVATLLLLPTSGLGAAIGRGIFWLVFE